MEEKIKVQESTKEPLLTKPVTIVETVKEKLVETKEELLKKAKESELAATTKEKFGEVKEGTQSLLNKVSENFSGKK
jgi:protoporphyrinogen oxidase